MKIIRPLIPYSLAILVALSCAGGLFAQAPLEPAQLPENTAFYMVWRGAPAADARKANSLYALWDDADFAPARSAMADNMVKNSDSKNKLTREELNEYMTLIENPFVVGYLTKPKSDLGSATSGASGAKEKKAEWNGIFVIYDRTGKEALLTKAMARMNAATKENPKISQVTIGGTKVQKFERAGSVTYWVESGKFAVSAGETSVMETVLARLAAKIPMDDSLGKLAAYREAKPLLGSGQLEFFAQISNAGSLAGDANVSGVKIAPLVAALKLESMHALAGHITLEGAKTHIQGALLGHPTAGSLFDIWGDGQENPASLAFVPAGAIAYSSSQINFLGIYTLVKNMVHTAFPQTNQGGADMVDMLVQSKLGMPPADMLGLFTGEFASVQTDPKMETSKQFFLLGIRKKAETVKLIHTLAPDNIIAEKEEGGANFLKLSLSNSKASPEMVEKNAWHMAVTDDAILIGANTEELHKAVAGRGANAAGGNFGSTPLYTGLRAKFPEKLNSISFYNFQKIDWAGLKERWVEESKKLAATKTPGVKTGLATNSNTDWLLQVDPKVFARHLHTASGGSWKDATGIHFDEWVD